jgi:hypothetical protein
MRTVQSIGTSDNSQNALDRYVYKKLEDEEMFIIRKRVLHCYPGDPGVESDSMLGRVKTP